MQVHMCGFCRCVQGRTGNSPALPSLFLASLRISRSANLRRYFHYIPSFLVSCIYDQSKNIAKEEKVIAQRRKEALDGAGPADPGAGGL